MDKTAWEITNNHKGRKKSRTTELLKQKNAKRETKLKEEQSLDEIKQPTVIEQWVEQLVNEGVIWHIMSQWSSGQQSGQHTGSSVHQHENCTIGDPVGWKVNWYERLVLRG